MNDVIKFETELARIMTPPEDHRDKEKLYNLMSLDELQNNASFVSISDRVSATFLSCFCRSFAVKLLCSQFR